MKTSIKILFLALATLFIVPSTYAGDNVKKHLRKAKKLRNLNKFEAAEGQYLAAINEDPTSFNAHFELGLLYEAAFYDPGKALESFVKAEDVMKDTVYELYYHMGRGYHFFEDYDKAIKYYELYKKGVKDGSDGAIVTDYSLRKIEQAKFAKTYKEHSFDGMMVNLGESVNTGYSEYVPVFIKKDSSLLFTRRGTENLGDYYWDNLHYEDMYVSYYENGSITQARSLKGIKGDLSKINNTKKHEAVVDISPAGDTLILYIKNKLWYSIYENDKWSEPEKFGKEINIAKYQRHACFTPDGKTLYFSSNDNDGLGGLDIYMSKLENDTWGEATNLGEIINTSGNEDSPFISKDGNTLYFASSGHEGMGGYDMYSSELKDGKWSEPVNMGTPVNSPADDIYLKIENEQQIYLSSNRQGGFGKMDIYEFKPYGIPLFEDSENEVLDTVYVNSMEIYEAKDEMAGGDTVTHYFWRYKDEIYEQLAYEMVFNDLGNEELELEMISRNDQGYETHHRVNYLITVIEEPIIDTTPDFVLKPIYFNFDKYDIRQDAREILDYNIQVLTENPDVLIEVIGHTDSKGSDSYNVKLSENRCKWAIKYLTKNGIDKDRIITVISKGESEPAVPNTNPDGSDNPDNRQLNRRVEFKPAEKITASEEFPVNLEYQDWNIEGFSENIY